MGYNNDNFDFFGQKPQRSVSEKIGNWFVGIVIFSLFILALFQSRVDNDPDHQKQLAIYESHGYKNYEQLGLEAERLKQKIPTETNCEPVGFYQWLVKVRIAKSAASDFYNWGIKDSFSNFWKMNGADFQGLKALGLQIEAIDGEGCKAVSAMRHQYGAGYMQEAQQNNYRMAIGVSSIRPGWGNLKSNLFLAYLFSILLMAVLMGLKAKSRDRSVIVEMLTPQRLPLAAVAWPITMWAYPYGSPLESLKLAVRFATYVLATFLSLGTAGVAKAQTSSSKNPTKKNLAGWVMQSDTRYGLITAGTGPDPQRQQRLTVTSPNGWMAENIVASNDRQWNQLSTWGKRIFRDKKITVNLLPGFRVSRSKLIKQTEEFLLLNGQIFANIPLPKQTPLASAIISANPVLQVERGIVGSDAGKHVSFTWVNQTFAKLKRFNLFPGWETVVSKSHNRPLTYSMGPLLEWQIPKKHWPRIGVGYIRNQAGAETLRFRLTQTYAF